MATGIVGRGTFAVIKLFVKLFSRRPKVFGAESMPEEPSLIIGNHSQIVGPVYSEVYFPKENYTWCTYEMMEIKEIAAYSYKDFWPYKPKGTAWLYRLVSYMIVPLAYSIFNNARTIPVYKDRRLTKTLRTTLEALGNNKNVTIFPECAEPHNDVVNEFQRGFTDVAYSYFVKTKKELSFIPVYIAPSLKQIHFGKPIRYDHTNGLVEERERICKYLMEEITSMAQALPKHRVVPYLNVKKKEYPFNK